MRIHAFQIYGDNLGECQKFCELLIKHGGKAGLLFQELIGPVDRPIYLFKGDGNDIGLLPCGRYEDWIPERRPWVGYEDPDIIACQVQESTKVGKPILAIEFNDAIEAGNNAWQRFPRIAQAAERGVTFIYQVPVCDAEVMEGEIRSFRHPNAIIQLAQLILMADYKTISLTTFTDSPWHSKGLKDGKACPSVSCAEGEKNLANVASSLIVESTHGNIDFENLVLKKKELEESFRRTMTDMLRHVSYFISADFTILESHPAFKQTNFENVAEVWWKTITSENEIPAKYRFYDWRRDDLINRPLLFRKSMSTESIFKAKVNQAIKHSSRRGGAHFLSYKEGANEIAFVFGKEKFAELLKQSYPRIENEVLAHILNSQEPITLLPIAGYVRDTGGPAFSRPDKGLVGLMKAVFARGQFSSRVVLLYSELVPSYWKEQVLAAKAEIDGTKSTQTNNLWREIVRFGTALIVDKFGSGVLI